MKFIIYKYTSPSKNCYIGITIDPVKRKKSHERKEWDYKDKGKFAQAIRRYGFNSFLYEEIDTANSIVEAGEKEKQWIKFYDSQNSGYNITEGGDYNRVLIHEERTVEDIKFMLKHTELTQHQIAKNFNVSASYVNGIKQGKIRSMEKIERTDKSRKGCTNGQSKLDDQKIKEIQEALKNGTSRRELQEKYNVSKSLIQQVATNNIWKHVESNYEYKPSEVNGNAKLNAEIVSQIKKDFIEKVLTMKQISDKFDISVPTLYQIKRGKTWKDVE